MVQWVGFGTEDDVNDVTRTVDNSSGTLDRDVSRFANGVGIRGVFRNLELNPSLRVSPTQLTAYRDVGVRDRVAIEVADVKLKECVILVNRSALDRFHLDDDVCWPGDTEEERRIPIRKNFTPGVYTKRLLFTLSEPENLLRNMAMETIIQRENNEALFLDVGADIMLALYGEEHNEMYVQ